MHTIADFTRVYQTTESDVVKTLVEFDTARPADRITVVRTDAQKILLPQSLIRKASDHVLPTGTTPFAIAEAIFNSYVAAILRQTAGLGSEISILSFHRIVLDLVRRIPPPQNNQVRIYSWSEVHRMFHVDASPPGAVRQYSAGDFLARIGKTKEELITLLSSCLQKRAVGGIPRPLKFTDIRTVLADNNAFFDKAANPSVNYPGFIGELMKFAEAHGVVKVDRGTNPLNWMIIFEPTPPTTLTTSLLTTGETSAASQPAPQSTPSSAQKVPHPRNVPEKWAETRSQKFIDVLAAKRLGPFAKVRAQLYEALDSLLAQHPEGLPVSRLLRESTARIRTKFNGAEYPWRSVTEFLTNILSRRSVLLGADGHAISVGFSTMNAVVNKLDQHWRAKLDGELIVALTENIDDIKLHDTAQLAGALFLERTDESETRVIEAIEIMLTEGKLVEDNRRLRPSQPARV